jgi:hypothetical protein
MTHKEIIDKLINDENVYENISVEDGYEPDRFGNSITTFSIEGQGEKKDTNGMLIMLFNKEGRLVSMEIATQKGREDWQIAGTGPMINFKQMVTGVDQ